MRQVVGAFVKAVDGVYRVGVFQGAEMLIDGFQNAAAAVKLLGADATGQVQVAYGKIVVLGVIAETEGTEGRTQITRTGEGIGLIGHADVGWQVVARAELVGKTEPMLEN